MTTVTSTAAKNSNASGNNNSTRNNNNTTAQAITTAESSIAIMRGAQDWVTYIFFYSAIRCRMFS
jgi:hypothetical protein